MKKTLKILGYIFLLAIILSSCTMNGEENNPIMEPHPEKLYYYMGGEKYSLRKVDGKFYVAFFSKDEENLKAELTKVGIELKVYARTVSEDYSRYADMTGSDAQKFIDFQTEIIEDSYKEATAALTHTFYWAPYYRMEDGTEIVPTELFTVIFKPGTTLKQLEKLAKENSVEMIGWDPNEYASHWYYLVCTNQSKGNSIQMANRFYESGLFEESFASAIELIVFD